jgi:hypothetical protein
MKLEESHGCCKGRAMNSTALPRPADEPPSRRVFIILNPNRTRFWAGGARSSL